MWWLLLGCAPADVRPGAFTVIASQWLEADDDCGFRPDTFPMALATITLADAVDGTFTLALSTVSSDPLACRLGPIDDLGDPTFTCLNASFAWPVGEDRVGVDWITEGSYDAGHATLGGEARFGAVCAAGGCDVADGELFDVLPCGSRGIWQATRASP